MPSYKNMNSLKHEDHRRILVEWIENYPTKSNKVIIAKEDCEVGNHYHLKKDEMFYLLLGEGEFKLGENEWETLTDTVFVPRGTRHTFRLKEGAILLEAATRAYTPDDEIRD